MCLSNLAKNTPCTDGSTSAMLSCTHAQVTSSLYVDQCLDITQSESGRNSSSADQIQGHVHLALRRSSRNVSTVQAEPSLPSPVYNSLDGYPYHRMCIFWTGCLWDEPPTFRKSTDIFSISWPIVHNHKWATCLIFTTFAERSTVDHKMS